MASCLRLGLVWTVGMGMWVRLWGGDDEEELTVEHIDYCIDSTQHICKFIEHIRACSYGGEPARLPGWPGRRDSFHLVFIWRNSSPLAETEI